VRKSRRIADRNRKGEEDKKTQLRIKKMAETFYFK
jgi:hypothetical protein